MKLVSLLFIISLYFFFAPKQAVAQTNNLSTPSAAIKYDLAYPGILPDSPLYKFKVLRDKLTEFLISNPQTKAEFYLLQADKGILASAILQDKKETKLSQDTALRAENYYTMLVLEVKKMRSKPNDKFIAKAKNAALKHQEIINLLIKRADSSESKDLFGKILYFSESNLKTFEDYISKHNFQN